MTEDSSHSLNNHCKEPGVFAAADDVAKHVDYARSPQFLLDVESASSQARPLALRLKLSTDLESLVNVKLVRARERVRNLQSQQQVIADSGSFKHGLCTMTVTDLTREPTCEISVIIPV